MKCPISNFQLALYFISSPTRGSTKYNQNMNQNKVCTINTVSSYQWYFAYVVDSGQVTPESERWWNHETLFSSFLQKWMFFLAKSSLENMIHVVSWCKVWWIWWVTENFEVQLLQLNLLIQLLYLADLCRMVQYFWNITSKLAAKSYIVWDVSASTIVFTSSFYTLVTSLHVACF